MIYPRLLIGFGMLVFFTNVSLMEVQVRYLALRLLFSSIDGFEWFWMGSLHKNIELTLQFLKAPFLLGPTLFLPYINVLPDDVLCDNTVYADDSFHSNNDQEST